MVKYEVVNFQVHFAMGFWFTEEDQIIHEKNKEMDEDGWISDAAYLWMWRVTWLHLTKNYKAKISPLQRSLLAPMLSNLCLDCKQSQLNVDKRVLHLKPQKLFSLSEFKLFWEHSSPVKGTPQTTDITLSYCWLQMVMKRGKLQQKLLCVCVIMAYT